MYVLGLTGSIGMGKSWGTKCFRHVGVPVHDADACVHALMAPNGLATGPIQAAFGDVVNPRGAIDRQKLAALVVENVANLTELEQLLHPLVRADQRAFLKRCRRRAEPLVVLDIPLLFETQSRARVDGVVVMSAPKHIQAQRVLRRPFMTVEKFNTIVNRQTPDAIKRQLADFVVLTGGPRGQSLRQIADVAKVCRRTKGHVWTPHWGV